MNPTTTPGPPTQDSARALAARGPQGQIFPQFNPRTAVGTEKRLKDAVAVGYRPYLPIYGTRAQSILGWEFYNDCDLMLEHDSVKLPLQYYMGPMAYAEWVITASSKAAGLFAADQLSWFWQHVLPAVYRAACAYGWGASELCYDERDGLLVLDSAVTFKSRDVIALLNNRTHEADGIRVVSAMGGHADLWAWRTVPNKGFWYAHLPEGGQRYGRSQIRAAWRPWRRLAGVDGLEEISDLAAHRFGTGIVKVLHPNETQSAEEAGLPGYAQNGMVHTRDIARFIGQQAKAGASITLPSEVWQLKGGSGGPKWDFKVDAFQTNLEQLGQFTDRLTKACSRAIGVPPELFEAAQTGSGYSGRAIPLQGFLTSQQDVLQQLTVAALCQVILPLVRWNYGASAWVRAQPKPLTESVRKSSWETPGEPPAEGAAPPPGGEEEPPPDDAGGDAGGGGPANLSSRPRIRMIDRGGGIFSVPNLADLDLPELLEVQRQLGGEVERFHLARRAEPKLAFDLFGDPDTAGGDGGGTQHAPAGGTTIDGKPFVGGQFIPNQDTPPAADHPKEEPVTPEITPVAPHRAPEPEPEKKKTEKEPDPVREAFDEVVSPEPEAPAEEPAPKPVSPGSNTPHLRLADTIAETLNDGEPITAKGFFRLADAQHGGTRAEGKYGQSEAYDSLEAGFNQHLAGRTDPTVDLAGAQAEAKWLADKLEAMPTQTNRTGNKDDYQQFSTPPHYSYAVNWLANLQPDDTVLEPSAGTGSLTVHTQNAGVAGIVANELDPLRAEFLKTQLGADNVHVLNAEHLSALLPTRGVEPPSVVLMNPPFSQTAGRLGDKKDLMGGANHVEDALKFLAPGGRLVAIVGGGHARTADEEGTKQEAGMAPKSATYKAWFKRMAEKYNLRANVGVGGDEYKKYGTSFGTRVLVFDKTGPQNGVPVTGMAQDIPDLMAKLEEVRNDRVSRSAATSGVPAGGPGAGAGVQPHTVAAPPVGAEVAAGQPGGVLGGPGGAGGGDAQRGPGVGDVAGGTGPGGAVPGDGRGPGPAPAGVVPGSAGQPPVEPAAKPGRGKGSRRKRIQLAEVRIPELRKPHLVPTEIRTAEAPKAERDDRLAPGDGDSAGTGDSMYEQYHPALLRVPGAKQHITPLVETAAMAAVKPPAPTYRPTLSQDIIEQSTDRETVNADGTVKKSRMGVSEAALESIVYAGQAHGQWLTGEAGQKVRRGYFIGDGTGTGKGREIGGVIADNINQGRKKHVWVSEKWPLTEDAKRDLADVGIHPDQLLPFDQLVKGQFAQPEGIAFTTYSTLKSGGKKEGDEANVDKLVKWLGPDFDGVIAFDEAHAMGNASSVKGARGKQEPSQQALAGLKLQQMLPKARVLYVSATGATEVRNLAYAERLGLWGPGTAFANRDDFVTNIAAGGAGSMEAVSQSLKAMGLYGARSMAMSDGTEKGSVTFDRLQHTLTDEQKYIHQNLSEAWRNVLTNIDKAIEATTPKDRKGNPIKNGGAARNNALSQFHGANLRFWNQVLTSFQTPTVISAMEKDLAEGRAPVASLVNTMESVTKKKLAERGEDESIEELDLSPKEILKQYLMNSFPVHRQQETMDDAGNVSVQVVVDPVTKEPVQDPEAVRIRDEMLANVNELRIPESPLDLILKHFGPENVAEVTGRTVRIVEKANDKGVKESQSERRNSAEANVTEAQAFQDGRKKVLVFSAAGGTGRSYHAERGAGNQGRRVHYMLQPGWRADAAMQALGRTHRTNQTSAPMVKLVEIPEIPGQRRYMSTIARRLAQLGALTKGERKAGGGGIFTEADNLESTIAQDALDGMMSDLKRGSVEGLKNVEVLEALGLAKKDDEEGSRRRAGRAVDTLPVTRFLNRMLSAPLDLQHKLMAAFEERIQSRYRQAVLDGSLDQGTMDYNSLRRAKSIDKLEDHVVFKDPSTGAEVRHIKTKVTRPSEKTPFAKVKDSHGFVLNNKSGRVWAVLPAGNRTDPKTGRLTERLILQGPTSARVIDRNDLTTWSGGSYQSLEPANAKELWRQEHDAAPATVESEDHFITGAMLPIWDRLPSGQPKIYKVRASDGESFVARWIPDELVKETLKNLGFQSEAGTHTGESVHKAVSAGTHEYKLANGWKVKPARVQGEKRIEVTGPMGLHWPELEGHGLWRENVQGDRRFFVPTGPVGVKVLENLIGARPVAEAKDLKEE